MQTPEERRAYGRGYNAGLHRRWPEHKPPLPPNELIAALMTAAQTLRDATDAGCALFDENDEFVQRLSPGIDALDEAMALVSKWLKEQE